MEGIHVTLKIAAAKFALEHLQHSTRLNPDSGSYISMKGYMFSLTSQNRPKHDFFLIITDFN
jgi:hypothetical protein